MEYPALDGLLEVSRRQFLDLAIDINDALVYLDAGSGEHAHVCLGLPFLFGLGAANVCDLERANTEDAYLPAMRGLVPTTVAIFITQLLTDVHSHILHAILVHPSVTRVLIYNSLSEHAHACQASTVLGVEAFTEYVGLLKQDIQEAKRSVAVNMDISIRYLPLHLCALSNNTFVLPANSAAAATARAGGKAAGFADAAAADDDDDDDGQGTSGGLSLLAHALGGIVAQLRAKLEVFAVGPVSAQIAQEVSTLPLATPHDTPSRPAPTLGLILVDRSLDLVSPCLHPDHVLDALLAHLPRRAGPAAMATAHGSHSQPRLKWRSLDMRIPVPELVPLTGPLQRQQLVGMELFNPSDRLCMQRIEQLISRKPKDSLPQLRKWLKESLRQEKLQPSVRSKAGSVPVSELKALAHDIASQPGAALRQRGVVALGYRAAAALAGPSAERWEAAGSLERQLVMMLNQAQDPGGALQVLMDALANAAHEKGPLTVQDILQLLVLAYSLAPGTDPSSSQGGDSPPHVGHASPSPFSPEDESMLHAALLDALSAQQPQQLADLLGLQPQAPAAATRDGPPVQATGLSGGAAASSSPIEAQGAIARHELASRLSHFFNALHYIAQARARLKDLQQLTSSDVFAENHGTVNPLLRLLVRKLLQQAELRDLLQVNSSAFQGLLSKGLNRFGLPGHLLASKARKPSDCSALLVFVVGGVSMAEVREVWQEYEEFPGTKPQLLLGGTSLLSPGDVLGQLL